MRLQSHFCLTERVCVCTCRKSRNLVIIAYPLLSRCSLTCQPAFHQPHPHLHLPPFCSISLLSAKQRQGSMISLTCRRNKGSSAIELPFMCSLLQSVFRGSAVIVDHFSVSMQGSKKIYVLLAQFVDSLF